MKNLENKILYVEDNPADRILLEGEAQKAGYPFRIVMASSLREAIELLRENVFQAVVCDCCEGDGYATDLMPLLGSCPIIIIACEGSEDTAVKALKAGAYDYLIKDAGFHYLKLLPITIVKSIEQRKQRDELENYRNRLESLVHERTTELTDMYQQLQESISNFRNIFNNTSDGFIITDYEFNFLEANNTLLNRFGITREFLTTQALINFLSPAYHAIILDRLQLVKQGLPTGDLEIEVVAPLTGRIIPYEVNNVPIMFNQKNAILTVMRDITERKSIARKLFETIIQTEEEERSRIARDLHDEIGPLMSALKIYTTSFLESDSFEKKDKLASQMGVIIRDVIESIKNISNDMSPHVLVNFGLHAALQNIVSLFSRNLTIHQESHIEHLRFYGTIESVMYRIIKELINNTIKHAHAKNIYISLNYSHPSLMCEYRDDGRGFDLQQQLNSQVKGMGFSNIISRIKSLGGDFNISTSPGNGFKINLQIKATTVQHASDK
jgi:PAS domain S-box-containing protein